MGIIKELKIKNIIDYELNNEINILDELQYCNVFVILDLIKMGNNCSDKEAEEILNKELKDKDIQQLVKDLAYEIIGSKPKNKEKCIDLKNIESFSDILEGFYCEIQTVDKNLSLSEFQNMSIKYMYKYAEGIKKRYIFNKNEQLRSQYSNVAMFMSAFVGKLKECPQLNEDGTIHKQTLEEKLLALSSK